MSKVFVTRVIPGDALAKLRAAHDVEVWDGALPPDPAALRAGVADADGLLCLVTDRIDRALLEAAPNLRAIANYAVGSDNIDLDVARGRIRLRRLRRGRRLDRRHPAPDACRRPRRGAPPARGGRRSPQRRLAYVGASWLAGCRCSRRDTRHRRFWPNRSRRRTTRHGVRDDRPRDTPDTTERAPRAQ